jgi:hypothetical protein
MKVILDDQRIEYIAKLAHEANAAYCRSLGDFSQPPWEVAPDWQKKSVINGVRFHIEYPTALASASHENWFKEKQADGWYYGPEKDPVRKTHPCMVPFGELPVEQQTKNHIFRSVVHACLLVGT